MVWKRDVWRIRAMQLCVYLDSTIKVCMHMQQNDTQNPEIQVYMKPLNVESRCNWMNTAAEALKCEKK